MEYKNLIPSSTTSEAFLDKIVKSIKSLFIQILSDWVLQRWHFKATVLNDTKASENNAINNGDSCVLRISRRTVNFYTTVSEIFSP